MAWNLPDYLQVPPNQLGRDCPVKVRIGGDQQDVAETMARAMMDVIRQAQQAGRAATLIVPVGPVDQFPILAQWINREQVNCRDVLLINMDEYLGDDDQWVPLKHPLSFRGFMNRKFYDLIDPALAPRAENRIFPDPRDVKAIGRLIAQRGGVDACFGGIGINGHIAFNEILASRRLRFYCNRPWQRGVVRRALHGPISPGCPASLLRLHPDAELTVANYVAEPPDIQLR
jgi:glucosamine-6-phosphate deaminase